MTRFFYVLLLMLSVMIVGLQFEWQGLALVVLGYCLRLGHELSAEEGGSHGNTR